MATKNSSGVKAKKTTKNPPSHPPYIEMVTEAIVILKERNGSSGYAIAKHIEDKQKQLPSNFKKLLLVQLKKFVASGKLVKVKGSFKIPTAKSKETKPVVPPVKKSVKPVEKKINLPVKTKAATTKPAPKSKVAKSEPKPKPKAASKAKPAAKPKAVVAKPKVVTAKKAKVVTAKTSTRTSRGNRAATAVASPVLKQAPKKAPVKPKTKTVKSPEKKRVTRGRNN